jgi:hypothetical protein
MRHAFLVFTLLLGAATCTASAGTPSDSGAEPTLEQRVLSELSPIAARDGQVLTLTLEGGRKARFESKDDCASGPQSCTIYRLLGLSPDRQFFVVELLGYESATRYWIARSTGKQYEVYADTNISPDGAYIVAANPVECCGVNGVFVWQIERGQLTERFRLKRADYPFYRFDKWTNPTTAQLTKISRADKAFCPTAPIMESSARLTRKYAGWVLDEPIVPTRVMCK